MKTFVMKVIAVVFFASFIFTASCQTVLTPVKDGVRHPDPLDKKDVPNIVIQNYYKDYPFSNIESWYAYPDDGTPWYVYSTNLAGGAPEYFLVEFTYDNTAYKVVYSRAGKRMTMYKTYRSDLPKPVLVALNKSDYKDWKMTDEKEEIWRDSYNKKVYKLVMEKGNEKHTLYYRQDGKLLRDKGKIRKRYGAKATATK
jgi:hypothetical protein